MTNNLLFELFEVKQKFLRDIPHPKLILKQITRIETKLALDEKLDFSFENIQLSESEREHKLIDFLDDHIQANLAIKHKISAAPNYSDLRDVLLELYRHQIILLKKLKSYLPDQSGFPDAAIKMSAPFDTYSILKMIRSKNLEENEIKNYLCTLLNASETGPEILLESFLRANKIISNG